MKELTIKELRKIEGGRTSFAYDLGTLIRCGLFHNQPAKLAITVANWWAQQ